jgi:predicted HNH restriction endonuclease
MKITIELKTTVIEQKIATVVVSKSPKENSAIAVIFKSSHNQHCHRQAFKLRPSEKLSIKTKTTEQGSIARQHWKETTKQQKCQAETPRALNPTFEQKLENHFRCHDRVSIETRNGSSSWDAHEEELTIRFPYVEMTAFSFLPNLETYAICQTLCTVEAIGGRA